MNNYFGIYVQALLAKNAANSLQKQLSKIKDLEVKVNPTFGKINNSELNRINKELEGQLKGKLEEAGKIEIKPEIDQKATQQTTNSIMKISGSLEDHLIPSLKNSGEQFNVFSNIASKTKDVANDLMGTIGKVAVWTVATGAIFSTKRVLEDLFKTFVELEDKLVSIARVSDNLDISKIFNGAYASANKYGAKLMDMLESTEEIARSYNNLNEQQVLAAAEAGILASTIAEMDGGDAVGTIIAVSNAYGLAVENGEKLIDMLNEVDNNFSVTSADIASAWERSAATAKTFGVELASLTGYITAISTVTQEAGTVIGNGLKTIMSRITTLPAAMDAVKSAGVDIFDKMTGQVRPVQDILEDLAGTWDNLSASQQQNIGVQVAGRYQLTRFLALMNNWEIAVDATATALNSEGSAARENAVYLESYTAKLNQLENAQAKLAYTLQDGGMSTIGKSWLDLKIAVTEAADAYFKIVDSTTFVIGSMLALIVFLSKTTNGYTLLTNVLKFFTTEQKANALATKLSETNLFKLNTAGKLYAMQTGISTASTKLFTAAQNASTSANNAGTAAFGLKAIALKGYSVLCYAGAVASGVLAAAMNLIPFVAIITAIGMLINGITTFISKNKEAKEAQEAQNKALVKNADNIKKLKDKYEELNRAIPNSSKIIDEKDYEQQQEILNDLAEQYTTLADIIKDENVLWEEKLRLMDEADAKADKEAKKKFDKSSNFLSNDSYVSGDQWGAYLAKTMGDKDLSGKNAVWEFGFQAIGQGKGDALSVLKSKYQEAIKSQQDYLASSKNVSDQEEYYVAKIREVGLANAKTGNDFLALGKSIDELSQKYLEAGEQGAEPFKKALYDLGFTEAEVNKVMSETHEIVESSSEVWDLYKQTLDEAAEGLAEFNNTARDVTDMFFGVADGTEEAIENMTMYMDMFGEKSVLVRDMADELANSFTFMGEKIFENGETLLANRDKLDMISKTMEIAKSNQELYAKSVAEGTLYVAKGYEQEWETVRSTKIAELTVKKEALEKKIEIWKAVVSGNKTMAEAYIALTENEVSNSNARVNTWKSLLTKFKTWVTNMVKGYKAVSDASSGDVKKAQANLDELTTQLDGVNASIKQWTDIKIVGTTIDDFKKLGDSAKDGSKKTIDYFKIAEEALLKYKAAVEAIDNELKILQERNKQLVVGSQAWFDNYAQQEKVIKRQQAAIKEYIKQVEVQLKNDKLSAEEKVKLQNIIQDLNLEYEKLNTTLYNNVEAQKKFYESQITEKLKLIQNLEKQRHKEAIDNIKKERQAFQDQIKEQINLMKKASAARNYEKELNELQEERLNILSQISRLEGDDSRLAKSRLTDLYKELEAVETKISDLNYDRNDELREDALNDLSKELDTYYDNLEEIENQKNEMITNSLDNAKDSLDIANQSINELKKELDKWGSTLSNFGTWAQNFDSLIKTMPTSNIVSAMVPVTQADGDGNVTTTQVVFNITGSTSDAKNISDEIVDNLIKAGLITPGNG